MATQGTAVLDFGAFPGAADASVVVTGQAGITAGSLVEAWVSLASATTDHSIDEHLLETIKVSAGNIVAGVGFTIYGVNTNPIEEPTLASKHRKYQDPGVYGKFNINWVWN